MVRLFACCVVSLAACSRPIDPEAITIRVREPQRVKECNVFINTVYDDHLPTGRARRTVYMTTACGVPESALKGQWWWGDGAQPPGFSLDVGDCMPLDGIYYCLEDVVEMESATFRPTYLKPEHPKGKLRRIQ
jgi:hypothetical protein